MRIGNNPESLRATDATSILFGEMKPGNDRRTEKEEIWSICSIITCAEANANRRGCCRIFSRYSLGLPMELAYVF